MSELLGRGKGRAEKFLKTRFVFCKIIIAWDPAPKRSSGARERPSPRAYLDQGNLLEQLVHVFMNTFRWSASFLAAYMTVTSDDCISACWKLHICLFLFFLWLVSPVEVIS